jgi:hypothetical protein
MELPVDIGCERLYDMDMGNSALLDAIDALEHTPYEHDIIEKFVCLDRLFASVIGDLDRFDRDNMWAICGAKSLRAWLGSDCDRTSRDASSIVRLMRLLRSLPETADAFASGSLSKGHVDVIAANLNDRNINEFAPVEADMIGHLANLSITDTTTVMNLWAERAKDAAADDHKPQADDQTEHLYLSDLLDNTGKLDGMFTGPNTATIRAALARCTAEPVEGEPVRTFAQRQADALVEMANRILQTTDATARRSADVMLLVPYDTFVNGGVASYADGTIVSPQRVRQLLCDAVVTPLLQGDAGQPLWMGQTVRTATDPQRRALVARDRHCAFPGCHRPAPWTSAHHVDEWHRDDGPTDIDNLCLLCTRHHTLLHQPGWHAKLTPEQTLEVTTPTGRVLRAPPRTELHRDPTKHRRRTANPHAPPPGSSP